MHTYPQTALLLAFLSAGCGLLDGVDRPKDESDGSFHAFGYGTAANLETGEGMSFSPQVAVEGDGGGTAIAVWIKQEDPDPFDSNPQVVYRLYASYYNGASWGTALVIDAGSASYFSAWIPKVAMDDAGNAIVVWQQNDGTDCDSGTVGIQTCAHVYTRTFRASDATWHPDLLSPPFQLNDSPDFSNFSAAAPVVAVEPDPNTDNDGAGFSDDDRESAIVVWSQYTKRDWREVFAAGSSACPGGCDTIRSMTTVYDRIFLAVGGAAGGSGDIYAFNPTGVLLPASIYNNAVQYEEANALVVYSGVMYAGFGNTAGDGEIRRCDPLSAVCDTNVGWVVAHDGNDAVRSMTVYNNLLYIGLGNSDPSGMGDVKRCDFAATSCDATGDFVLVLDHAANTYGAVPAMVEYNGALYIGLYGDVDGDGDVKRCVVCDGTDWVTVLNNTGTYNVVRSMTVHAGRLYVGLGNNAGGDGDVMRCTVCDGTDWVTVFTDGGSTTYEVVLSMASYQGYLYIGMGAGTGDGDIWRCSVCDGSDWAMSRNDAATYEGVFSLHVYPGSGTLYAGFGSTAATDGDLFAYEEGWRTVARRCLGLVGEGTACGDSTGEWGTTDAAVCQVGSSGVDDGICHISPTIALIPSDSPVVAMDVAGRATAAFIQQVGSTCFAAETDNNFATPPGGGGGIPCLDASFYATRFDPAATPDWESPALIDPNAPVDSDPTATDSPLICFQNGDSSTENLSGFSVACQSAAQPQIAMSRSGNVMVVVKVSWQEAESADSNASFCDGGVSDTDFDCDSGTSHIPSGAPPADAFDEWNGNAIAARRFDQGTGTWAAAPTFLYAHSNQPSNATSAGGSERFYNCPAAGRVQTETNRWLIECNLNAPQIAIGDTDNNPATNTDIALAVWERFDGTNYDVYADCFTFASATTCGTAPTVTPCGTNPSPTSGWRARSCNGAVFVGNGFAIPEPGDVTNDSWTTPYAVLNDTAVSREAFSPQVALDATGNGLVVWTQKDTASRRWRIYGMRFRAGTGFDTATRGTIDNYGSGDFHYTNPVLAMEWQNAGNAANCPLGVNCGNGWALFLESEYFPGGLLPPSLHVRVRANRWTCDTVNC